MHTDLSLGIHKKEYIQAKQIYTILPNAELIIESIIEPTTNISSWAKVGLQMMVPEAFNTITWMSKGPYATYSDRNAGAKIGLYTTTVDKLWTDYVVPQENANRSEVRWVRLYDASGNGIFFRGATNMNFSAYYYSDNNVAEAKHINELKKNNDITFNFDYQQYGLGTAGAGPGVLPRYRLNPRPLKFTVLIAPFDNDKNENLYLKTNYPQMQVVKVPDLRNIEFKQAIKLAKQQGFVPKIKEQISYKIKKSIIITQFPSHGNAVSVGSQIQLIVSKGIPKIENNIVYERWNNVKKDNPEDVPVHKTPDEAMELRSFDVPENVAEEYGARVRAVLNATLTGNYTFWISSDDASVLYLSQDKNPGQKEKIAFVEGFVPRGDYTMYTSQQSKPIKLIKGENYYIEAVLNENIGGDHLSVAWKLPNGRIEKPIPLSRFIGGK